MQIVAFGWIYIDNSFINFEKLWTLIGSDLIIKHGIIKTL